MKRSVFSGFISTLSLFATISFAQNPLITNQFSADPTARVFNGKIYIYPSHDIPCGKGQGFIGFCMADYHVFSSQNLTEWQDHGVILTQNDVPWVNSSTYSMWAPDCVYKNGKYYLFFPAISTDTIKGKNRRIGVATSLNPEGPFVPEKNYLAGVKGIDPNVLFTKDGQAYIYWGNESKLYVAKLKENLLELASEPKELAELPPKFKEGPFAFERNGKFYLTFPYVPQTIEQLVYAIGDSPMGPFEYKGLIMKESPIACWTNHQSIVDYNGQSYLFYHHNDLSPKFDKNRSIKADSLFFNPDGTIREVIPSLRGIGISRAESQIQTDRYSAKSASGVSFSFVDSINTFKGWKVTMNQPDSWIRYNKVDFSAGLKKFVLNAKSTAGSSIEIRLDALNSPVLATVRLEKSDDWKLYESKLKKYSSGVHDLIIVSKSQTPVELDWVKFE
jgi:hypothetical protein